MGQTVPLPLSVRGALDTADPESASAPGTLRDATDLAHRWWGPRPGRSTAATIIGLGQPTRNVYTFNGADTYITYPYIAEQYVMGLSWTIDILFEFTALASGVNTILSRGDGTNNDIQIGILGSASAAGDQRKVRVVVSASTSSAISTTTTLTGTTQLGLSANATPAADTTYLQHIRVVRNVGSLYLYVNGTLEASDTSTLSTTVGNAGPGSSDGWVLGRNSPSAANTYLSGWIYKMLCRPGSYQTLTDGWLDVCHSTADPVVIHAPGGVHTFFLTQNEATDAGEEMSRFRNFGTMAGTGSIVTLTGWPTASPIQGFGYYTDRYGRVINIAEVSGRIFQHRAH